MCLLPAVVSTVALVAGLAGLAWAHDWKMLLAIAPNVALTELLAHYDPAACLLRGGDDWTDIPALRERMQRLKTSRFAALFVELAGRSAIASLMTILPGMMMAHFTNGSFVWTWYRICLFAGSVVLPWGYLDVPDRNRTIQWGLFAYTALGACALALPLACGPSILGGLQICFAALLVLRAFVHLPRKESRAVPATTEGGASCRR